MTLTTTEADARDLLLAAGVPEREITANSIQYTRVLIEVIHQQMAKLMAEKIIEQLFGETDGPFKVIRERLDLR